MASEARFSQGLVVKTIFVSSSGLKFRGREDFSGLIRIASGRGIETTVEGIVDALSGYRHEGLIKMSGNLNSMVAVPADDLAEFAECAVRQELLWKIRRMPTEQLLSESWVREAATFRGPSLLSNNNLVRVAMSGINSR